MLACARQEAVLSSISASVTSRPITASVTAGGVSASVSGGSAAKVNVGGGVGPQGPQGPAGADGSTSIAAASDVALEGVATGDLLRYSSGKWRNFPEQDVVIDGSNF